jgi:iron uptake system EfeUOB component EfeO/EfeM
MEAHINSLTTKSETPPPAESMAVSIDDYHQLLAIGEAVNKALKAGDITQIRELLSTASGLHDRSMVRAESYTNLANAYNKLVGKCFEGIE